jgi:hypothetical protein
MTYDGTAFPAAMTNVDVAAMREAVRLAAMSNDAPVHAMAPIVFRYYQRGLTNPERLAAIAVFLASSHVFQQTAMVLPSQTSSDGLADKPGRTGGQRASRDS